jgi:hypothetical protein
LDESTQRLSLDNLTLLPILAIEQQFKIHRELICDQSPFFKAAFTGKFIEGQNQCMKLDDTEPEVFGLLFNWLYFRAIGAYDEDLLVLAKIWSLAELCLMPELQNKTIDLFHGAFRRWIWSTSSIWSTSPATLDPELFDYVYQREIEIAQLKRCLVETLCFEASESCLTDVMRLLSTGALMDVIVTLKKRVSISYHRPLNTRHYHMKRDGDDEQPRCYH